MMKPTFDELIATCQKWNDDWEPKGRHVGDDFELTSYRGDWNLKLLHKPGELLGDHITDVPSLTLEVNGKPIDMTWGEALELGDALRDALSVAMHG